MGVLSILGLLTGVALIVTAVMQEGDSSWFLNPMGIAITVGGTLCSSLVTYRVRQLVGAALRYLKIVFASPPTCDEGYELLLEVAKQARREGFVNLSVQRGGRNLDFLSAGVELLADGVDPDQIHYIMQTRSQILAEEYRLSERIFGQLAQVAPMFGLLGTVIGLILMLNNVENTEAIPRNMAVALVTTFYGIALAGLIFVPIAAKFRTHNEEDQKVRDMMTMGVLSVQAGDTTRLVKEKLDTFVAEK